MPNKLRVGILAETKNPPDTRVPLVPAQLDIIAEKFPNIEVYIQPSDSRCFSNDEYTYLEANLNPSMEDCDILMGVKEVKIDKLIPNKTYLFFSHVAKKQPHNRELLRAILQKNITLIDYEYLTRPDGSRIVAFGRWAGIVGAYNALRARGNRTNYFKLKPAHECRDMEEMYAGLRHVKLKPIKILITGGGRVANGAIETLSQLKIRAVTPRDFLTLTFEEPVYCKIEPMHYAKRIDGQLFDMQHFINFPDQYVSVFKPYTKVTDIFIACHFWDTRAPHFITKEDFSDPEFKITVIADVSCDINGPIYSTKRASTITEPFYGYNPQFDILDPPFIKPTNITVMAVDNLPGELPRDASREFGNDLIDRVFPSLFLVDDQCIIERATIAKKGKLTAKFAYLQDYVDGKD